MYEACLFKYCPRLLLRKPPQTADEWTKVLDVSRRWHSSHLRFAAIERLRSSSVFERLPLATKYDIHEWLPDIMVELAVENSLPPKINIPLYLVNGFLRGREAYRSAVMSKVLGHACYQVARNHHLSTCQWARERLGVISGYMAPKSTAVPFSGTMIGWLLHNLQREHYCDACLLVITQWEAELTEYATTQVKAHCFPSTS